MAERSSLGFGPLEDAMDRLVLHESLVLHERPGESTPSQLASSISEPTGPY